MTTEEIRALRDKLVTIRSEATLMLLELRKKCPHVNKVGKYKGNTGNWCQDDDSYWIEASCPDCDATWHIDSETEMYRTFDGTILRDA